MEIMIGISFNKGVNILSEPFNYRVINTSYIFRAGDSPNIKNALLRRKIYLGGRGSRREI
jgi:hypothetical protein